MIEKSVQIEIANKIKNLFKEYTLSEQIDLLERINKDNRRKNSVIITNDVKNYKFKK